ncbi:MAG: hypothetical protein NEA02_06905 [Thermoanaerobaculia bacterium]|nr:hypothetical protein [Thermoanaerobaculia bacterium]
MTDRNEHRASEGTPVPVDGEISFRGIRSFVAALSIVTLVVFGLMWAIATFFKGSLLKQDPAPAALAEAREAHVPPGPNLQANPSADMAAFRAAEERELATWAWVDKEIGVARVPALRAMEIVLSRGLPAPPPMPPPIRDVAPAVEARQ